MESLGQLKIRCFAEMVWISLNLLDRINYFREGRLVGALRLWPR